MLFINKLEAEETNDAFIHYIYIMNTHHGEGGERSSVSKVPENEGKHGDARKR